MTGNGMGNSYVETGDVRISHARLVGFCADVFVRLELPDDAAWQAANVLVAADVRGISSHGVGRLWRYVNGLQTGLMVPQAQMEIVRETPMSLVVDAHGGMGAPVSVETMTKVISKAEGYGAAFACVRDSNHFGIAGYYAMMALEKDMIGIAMTNTAALGVPTFGRQAMFGTNPIAFAAPARREKAFVLDMSTTVVTRGKIEVYGRAEKPLPLGWAVDKSGRPATDARSILDDMLHRHGGGILPLGGTGEEYGGHKGYGLAVMVDILCAALCGAPCGPAVRDTETSSARVSHFFGTINISAFRAPEAFRNDVDRMLEQLRDCPPAEAAHRVYFAGQKEFEHEQQCLQCGVPIHAKAYESLCTIAKQFGVAAPSAGGGSGT